MRLDAQEALDPRPVDEERLEGEDRDQDDRRHRTIGTLRLVAALAVPFLFYFARWWALLPLAAFVVLVIAHARVTEARRRARKAVAFYEMGIARIEATLPERWMRSTSAAVEAS